MEDIDLKIVTRRAYAKVNLALDVIRKREDGYHDVCMIMQNLNLYDTLTFTMEPSQYKEITLACNREYEILFIKQYRLCVIRMD